MTEAATYLVDPDASCRRCDGKGKVREVEVNVVSYYTCEYCGGSGLESVAILPAKEGR